MSENKITLMQVPSVAGTTLRITSEAGADVTVVVPQGHWEKTENGAKWIDDEPREVVIKADSIGALFIPGPDGNWTRQELPQPPDALNTESE